MIPPEILQQIRERTDILELIGQTVELKRHGNRYKGLCPFHTEKSPSFIIGPDRQSYFCFGCRASGDAIKFLQEHNGMSFVDAAKFLADKLGIYFSEVKETLAPKRFKKLAIIKEEKTDEKVAFVDREKASLLLIDELNRSASLTAWLGFKSIPISTVKGMAIEGKMGWWGGRLVYFYPGGAIKIRESLESSRTSRWLKGSADDCWPDWHYPKSLSGISIFEGETDLLRSDSLTRDRCISIPSASWTPTPEQCYKIGAFREVTFCFDGDEAGRNATARIATLFKKHANGCKLFKLDMPDGKDCCNLDDKEMKILIDNRIPII